MYFQAAKAAFHTGAEQEVSNGARELLTRAKPTIVLALHGEEQRRRCRRILQELDYVLYALDGRPLTGDTFVDDEIYALPR